MTQLQTTAKGHPPRWSHMLHNFIHNEAFGGILMLVFAIAAMIWANSRWADEYISFWHTYFMIGTERFNVEMTLQHWVNDALMAIFFLIVGLEIKRELLVGELASVSRATLPVVAALGGAIVPALLYTFLNAGTAGGHGWGVPMATDIAFAVGVVILAGNRVPLALRVFLMALAIVDDLLAVLVIAVFYTADLDLQALGGAAAVLAALVVVNRLGIRRLLVYVVLGVGLWYFVLQSGVHATIAGVLLALTVPVNTHINPAAFVHRVERILGRIERDGLAERNALTDGHIQDAIQELEGAVNDVEAPLQNLERPLHPWSAFLIIPVFALANAGVRLDVGLGEALTDRVTLGVFLGLIIGKQVGITGSAWLAIRFGLAALPSGVTWQQIYAVSWIAGIGFTMSIFISELAFNDDHLLKMAKIGVFSASLVAGVTGWLLLRYWAPRRLPEAEVVRTS